MSEKITHNASGYEEIFAQMISMCGDDIKREGLQKTPVRASNAFQYLTQGYSLALDNVVNGALFDCSNNNMVVVKDIEFYSLCEHHILPFIGKCHIGYIPDGKILGLSKLARITDMYARRLQVQENLTNQIGEAIYNVTGAQGVGVIIEATHLCMVMRGVEKLSSSTRTVATFGSFKTNDFLRKEFLSSIKMGDGHVYSDKASS